MKVSNTFYFKNIVDIYYPDEDRPSVDVQSVVSIVQKDVTTLNDSDFEEVMIGCFIPDLYSGMGKCEKLFTKLTELMVGEWWRRLGGSYRLPTKKSGTEDVELKYQNISVVCDAKVFRLGRSQKAPNVKDFLKLASVNEWINNLSREYNRREKNHIILGGLVTYSSLHEWESDSEVYQECTNPNTPVVMLPYEVMALLLKYKDRFELADLFSLWNYKENGVVPSRRKEYYWNYLRKFICDLLSFSEEDFYNEIKQYHVQILEAVNDYRGLVENTIEVVRIRVEQDMAKIATFEEMRQYAVNEIIKRDNATALDYLKHINDFRLYKDIV